MDWLAFPIAGVFALLGAVGIGSIVLSLPGTWLILFLAFLIELTDGLYLSGGSTQTFAWWLLGVCLALAVLSEVIDFLSAALGAKAGGGSKRGMWGAIIGGIIGAIVLTPMLAFLPIIGTLVGALAGTFVGAYVGEVSQDDATNAGAIRPAFGATIGRIVGMTARIGIAVAIWIMLSIAAFVP